MTKYLNGEEDQRLINIIMQVNDAYAPYLATAVYSMMEFSSPNDKYKVNVLYSSLSVATMDLLKEMMSDNFTIEFINVSNYILKYQLSDGPGYLTKESAYRLLVGEFFPEIDKILYLDVDIIVNKDLAELFSIDVSEYYLGAVRELLTKKGAEYVENSLDIKHDSYFNAGVLLINLKKFREEELGEKALCLLEKKTYCFYDNDVINIVCKDKVKYLDERWNMEWHYTYYDRDMMNESKYYNDRGRIIDDPWIIHYTDKKPWKHPEYNYSLFFWKMSVYTPFFKDIILDNWHQKEIHVGEPVFSNRIIQKLEECKLESHTIKEKIRENGFSYIDIYGFGKIGKRLFIILFEQNIEVNAIIDRNQISHNGINITHPNEYLPDDKSLVVLAMDEADQKDALKVLNNKGIKTLKVCGIEQFIDYYMY